MANFKDWFDKNSGYSLHRTPMRKFSIKNCCGFIPENSGFLISFPNPMNAQMQDFILYKCKICGKFFVEFGGSFAEIDNLMKFKIIKNKNF